MPEMTMEWRLTELEKKFTKFEETNAKEHHDFSEKFQENNIANAINAERYSQILGKLDTLQNDVSKLNAVPVKRLNDFVKSILTAIGGAIGLAIIYAISQAVGGG